MDFDETCGECLYFHAGKSEREMGTCWRYPPEAFSLPIPAPSGAIQTPPNDSGTRPGGIMTLPIRPPVAADTAACGEWDDGSHGNLIEEDEPGDGA